MSGNAIIIILLVPILFQVVSHAVLAAKRHRETQARLQRIEELVGRLSGSKTS